MFAIIYQWKIKSGYEKQFREAWLQLTDEFSALHGGLGSRLHDAGEGIYVAYARWPSRKIWEKKKDIQNTAAVDRMNEAIEENSPSIPLEVLEDKLSH